MIPVHRNLSAPSTSTQRSAPDNPASASAAGEHVVAVMNSTQRMDSASCQRETGMPLRISSEKTEGSPVVTMRPEEYEKLIYGKATGRTSSLLPFGDDVIPAGNTAELFATVVTSRGRPVTDDVVVYNRAPGWVFISHPPAVGRSPAYIASLREDFLAMVRNPDFNYLAEKCLPNYGVMTTISMFCAEGVDPVGARVHLFYLDAFRPKDVNAFLRAYFDAIVSACEKVKTDEEARAISFLMSTNYYWDHADVPPVFAGDMTHEDFISIRDQLLAEDKFSGLRTKMMEKAKSCEALEQLVSQMELNNDPAQRSTSNAYPGKE